MNRFFEFGPFRVNEGERTLVRDGAPLALTPKNFNTLIALLANSGRLVGKEELIRAVWADVHVDESVLTKAISDLRKILGQPETGIWIETVPKFGYRFSSAVQLRMEEDTVDDAPAPLKSARLLWPVVVASMIVVAAAIALTGLLSGTVPKAQPIHRLAVLPFQVTGQQSTENILGEGIADAVITRLSNLHGLIVRPMSVVRRFEGPNVDPQEAGVELQADAVLEGTLLSDGGQVRVYARLIRPQDGQALWSQTVESGEKQMFRLQDSLAQQVAAALAVRLSNEERQSIARRSELNPEAHRLYVNGRYEWGKRTREGFEKAAEYFRQAIDIDPGYARAYAGLADCQLLLGAYGYAPQLEMLPQAKAIALRALQLEPGLAEAHATLGLVVQNLDWDWKMVESHYREAIRLAPSYSTAHHWYAEFLSIVGRYDESHREFERAREIDPISPAIAIDEAQLYFFERQYGRALEILEKVLRDDPSFALARERMARVYMAQGKENEAWREVESLPECADPKSECRLTWTAWLPSRDPQAARTALAELESRARARGNAPAALVVGYARQGDPTRALDWLERMVGGHEVWLITLKVNPVFDPIRGEPRTRTVLHTLHLD
jgi:DNA-binding winged helix-turn-helix (wHTH) protein/TolB-like protein/thioredoxin-like negative regulator of GroEL